MVLRDDSDVYWRRDVERRLAQLEGAPQAGYQSITDGGMVVSQAGADRIVLGIDSDGRACIVFYDALGNETLRLGELDGGREGLEVYDGSGNPTIRAGELQSGGYGLEAISGAVAVTLAALGFGVQAAAVATAQSPGSTGSYIDLATVGPSVTVTVGQSGRLLIVAGARIMVFSNEDGFLGYTLAGANTLAATKITTLENGNTGGLISASTAGFEMLTGLNPGVTTVQLKYRSTSVLSQFAERVVVAFPL